MSSGQEIGFGNENSSVKRSSVQPVVGVGVGGTR